MNKTKLIETLSLPMLLLGIGLCSIPYIALIRVIIGIDKKMQLPFTTTLVLLIGGYMAALGSMIYLSRKSKKHIDYHQLDKNNNASLRKPHYLGLTMLIPFPFISFILIYSFWRREGVQTKRLDSEYRKSLNFQITIHLYWLLSFFLMPVVLGFFTFTIALLLHLVATFYVIISTKQDSEANYPANIQII